MKIRIHLSSNKEAVPYNYAHRLSSVFHHWLGPNKIHDVMSLYSIGWLQGGQSAAGSLHFPRGARWEIGIWQDEVAEKLIQGLLLKPMVLFGMRVRRVDRVEEPDFSKGQFRFWAGSPIILRKVEDDYSRTFVCYDKPNESSSIMTRILHKKMKEAGIKEQTAKMKFDERFDKPKTKLIDIKGIKNRGSMCPVITDGSPEILKLAWTVGAGELTGSGFGSLIAR